MSHHTDATERTFTMDLTPSGHSSCVLLDGTDISGLLRGVSVRSSVDGGTVVQLEPGRGARAEITARLPEARIFVTDLSPTEVCIALHRWLHHHTGCARVREGDDCSCGLNKALSELKGIAR